MDDSARSPRPRRAIQGPDDPKPGEPVPPTHFVLLGHPRSGSTMLVKAMRANLAIRVYGELFNDEPEARHSGFRLSGAIYETGMDGAAFLKGEIFKTCYWEELFAIGFKLFYTQARDNNARSAWRYLIGRPDIRVIHLTRDNALDTYVSLCEASTSGQWCLNLEDEPPVPGPPVYVDLEECLKFLDRNFAYRNWVRRAFNVHDVLELSYERHLVADFDAALLAVQSFLGVPAATLPVLTHKQATRPLEERISNYNEIRQALRRTIHAD